MLKYLGVAFKSDGSQDEELDIRIGKASAVMRTLHYLVVIKREQEKFSHFIHLYKKLSSLKLNDSYHLEHAKFMHKICNNKLPLLSQQ